MTKPTPYDGSLYLEGRVIRRRPRERLNDDGSQTISMGFPICEVHECVKPEDVLDVLVMGEIAGRACKAINLTNPLAAAEAMAELVGALDNLLADVLNIGSFSIKSRPSVESAQDILAAVRRARHDPREPLHQTRLPRERLLGSGAGGGMG